VGPNSVVSLSAPNSELPLRPMKTIPAAFMRVTIVESPAPVKPRTKRDPSVCRLPWYCAPRSFSSVGTPANGRSVCAASAASCSSMSLIGRTTAFIAAFTSATRCSAAAVSSAALTSPRRTSSACPSPSSSASSHAPPVTGRAPRG
jgi:hypothetical protein